MSSLATAIKRYGLFGMLSRLPRYFWDDLGLKEKWYRTVYPESSIYKSPDEDELRLVSRAFQDQGIPLTTLSVNIAEFNSFMQKYPFPEDYHSGVNSGVWAEKMLEHYIAWSLLGLDSYSENDIYIDIAACGSPWAHMVRTVNGINACAIDLVIDERFKQYDYYIRTDATRTDFSPSSVRGASLQCAFELFEGDHDTGLISELGRILQPGGKCVISPLYMHTHYCCYASPENFRKGYAPGEATEYLRPDIRGITSSRKYDAATFRKRIYDLATSHDLDCRIIEIDNKAAISKEIYCTYICVLEKK